MEHKGVCHYLPAAMMLRVYDHSELVGEPLSGRLASWSENFVGVHGRKSSSVWQRATWQRATWHSEEIWLSVLSEHLYLF